MESVGVEVSDGGGQGGSEQGWRREGERRRVVAKQVVKRMSEREKVVLARACESQRMRGQSMCVCVCARARACVCVCVCVCYQYIGTQEHRTNPPRARVSRNTAATGLHRRNVALARGLSELR